MVVASPGRYSGLGTKALPKKSTQIIKSVLSIVCPSEAHDGINQETQ